MIYPFKSKNPTLSLCMIVKNEEGYLHDCLQSVCDLVDEIIIVDTGSTDKTLAIASKFSAQIYHFTWQKDFSAARNASIKHATSDWIFYLDADERLFPESKVELKKLLLRNDILCFTAIIDSPKSEGKKGHFSRAHRLFRNVPGIRFSGRIHEQISPSVLKLGGKEATSNIKLLHYGYGKSDNEMQQKSERNYELLKKQLADDPDNAYYHFTLAQNLILSDRYEDALSHLQRALEIGTLPKDIVCSIFNNLTEIHMRLGQFKKAIDFAERAIAMTPEQTTSYLLMYEAYGFSGDKKKQIECLEAVINLVDGNKQAVNEVSLEAYVDRFSLHLNLANLYYAKRNFKKAHDHYHKAVEIDEFHISALNGLYNSFFATGDFLNAIVVLEKLKKLNPDDPIILEKLGLAFIKVKNFVKAIDVYEQSLQLSPTDSNVLRRLAALYHKIGQYEKSKDYLLNSKVTSFH